MQLFFYTSGFCFALFTFLKCLQFPLATNQSFPLTYYEASTTADLNHLFSKKTMSLEGVKVQGIIITGKKNSGPQGYVVLEIDGKNLGPVEVGETFGKGIYLQSITDNSAVLSYQGQKTTVYLSAKPN